jgi:hypothetical protein
MNAGAWCKRHERALLWSLVAIGLGVRLLVAIGSPQTYGYVYDFYHQGIERLYETGHAPLAMDCWQCYHPPSFYYLGLPLYAFGRWMAGPPVAHDPALLYVMLLPAVSGAVVVLYGYRLFRLFRLRGAKLLFPLAITLVLPCLAISSYGLEADIVLTAVMVAFLYYLTVWFGRPRSSGWRLAAVLGVLAGLAAATKYSGLVAVVAGVALMGARVLVGSRRRTALVHLAVFVVLAGAIGSWRYVDNVSRYGTPMFARGTAKRGFMFGPKHYYWEKYEFTSLRLGDMMSLVGPSAPPGELTNVLAYRSVWGTLHALAWSDMSFFSDPRRYGDNSRPYPLRSISPTVYGAVLLLGLLPDVLALLGFALSIRHRLAWPAVLVVALTMGIYVYWVVSQPAWALKTKYVLFLLPAYALWATWGCSWLSRRLPAAAFGTLVAALVALIAIAHVYLYQFALGGPVR